MRAPLFAGQKLRGEKKRTCMLRIQPLVQPLLRTLALMPLIVIQTQTPTAAPNRPPGFPPPGRIDSLENAAGHG